MGTLGVGKDERRDMVSIRYEKNEGVRVFVQWRGEALVSDHARLWLVIEGTKGEMTLVVSWIAEVEDWGQPLQGIVNGYDGI